MRKSVTPKKLVRAAVKAFEDQTDSSAEPSRYSLRSSARNTPVNTPQKKDSTSAPVGDLDSPGPRTRSQVKIELLGDAIAFGLAKADKSEGAAKSPGLNKRMAQKVMKTPPAQRLKSRKEDTSKISNAGGEVQDDAQSLDGVQEPTTLISKDSNAKPEPKIKRSSRKTKASNSEAKISHANSTNKGVSDKHANDPFGAIPDVGQPASKSIKRNATSIKKLASKSGSQRKISSYFSLQTNVKMEQVEAISADGGQPASGSNQNISHLNPKATSKRGSLWQDSSTPFKNDIVDKHVADTTEPNSNAVQLASDSNEFITSPSDKPTLKRGRPKKDSSRLVNDDAVDRLNALINSEAAQLVSDSNKIISSSNDKLTLKRGRPKKDSSRLKDDVSNEHTSTCKRERALRRSTSKYQEPISPTTKKAKYKSNYIPRPKKEGGVKLKSFIPTFMPLNPTKCLNTASLFHLVHYPMHQHLPCRYLTPEEALPYMDSTSLAPNTFNLAKGWEETLVLTPGQATKGPASILNSGLSILAMEYSPCGQYLAVGGSFLDQKVTLSSAAPLLTPNGLQLWKLRGEAPELAMVICHGFGPVTSLGWLPSGIHEDAPFIGLLAFASTSGMVYIVHVPKPPAPCAFLDLSSSPLLIATLGMPNAPFHCLKWSPASHSACLVVGSNHGSMAGYSLLKPLSDYLSGHEVDFKPRFFCQSHRGILQWVDFLVRFDGSGDLIVLSSASDGNMMYLDWSNPRRTLRLLNMKIAPSPAQPVLPVGSDVDVYSYTFFTPANCMLFNQRKRFPLDNGPLRSKLGIIEDDRVLCSDASPLHRMLAVGYQKGLLQIITTSTYKDRFYKAATTHLSISCDPAFPRALTVDDWHFAIPKNLPVIKNVYASTGKLEHFVPAQALRNIAWNPNPEYRYELSVSTATGVIFISSIYESSA